MRNHPPSQGQEIPEDQLDALCQEQRSLREHVRQAYRVGFAAALGYEITVEEGRVGIGDRPDLDVATGGLL